MKRYFNNGKGRICYHDSGVGDVIVLVHGYLETSEAWIHFAGRLSERFRVIAVDLPGHGGSDIQGGTCSMEFMASAISDLTESLKTGKIFLTGHSLGGYVTLAFADLFPQKLTGYCLFSSQPFADTPGTIEKRKREIALVKEGRKDLFCRDNIAKMFADQNLDKFPDELLRFTETASSIPGDSIIAVLNAMMTRPSRLDVMEKGDIPCLWILGAKDNYINCEQIQLKVKLPPNAKAEILQYSGHLGFVEEEERAAGIITRFMDEISSKIGKY